MSFSFGFVISDEPERDSKDDGTAQQTTRDHLTQQLPNNNLEATLTNQSRDHLLSFRWIEGVEELIDKRRTEQIIYDEIHLETSSATCESDDSDAHLLRVVDLTRSSFADSTAHVKIEASANDLVPGVYEGGLKVWESLIDLVRFLHEDRASTIPFLKQDTNTEPFRFLELGCGHGLVSCYIMRLAAHLGRLEKSEFWLTDYNDFVLKDAALSNVVLNMAGEDIPVNSGTLGKHVRLAYGDWFGLLGTFDGEAMENAIHRIDWIAAAETIYTQEAAQETAFLILKLLRPETGLAWVASKRYYFGVGGGVDAFRMAAASLQVEWSGSSYKLDVETVKVVDTGNANIREILKVKLVPA